MLNVAGIIDPLHGPVLGVLLGFPDSTKAAMQQNGGIPQAIQLNPVLIDTGSSHTLIDEHMMASLHIPPNGSAYASSPALGMLMEKRRTYYARITFYDQASEKQWFDILAVGTPLSPGLQGVIGRDILDQCTLTYEGKKCAFTIDFR